MRLTAIAGLLAALTLAGCQSAKETPDSSSPDFRPERRETVEITPGHPDFERQRNQARAAGTGRNASIPTEGDILELPKYVVTETGYINFGMSVVTNPEVQRGGLIKWMRVGMVIPGSLAARNRLNTWDQILAIDGVMVTELGRDGMMRALFQRQSGDQLTLLIMAPQYGMLPVFIRLTDRGGQAR